MIKHPHVRYEKAQSGTPTNVVTTAEAKAHLRVDFDDDDTYIASVISASTSYISDYCNVIFGASVAHYAYWDCAYPVVYISMHADSVDDESDIPVLAKLNSSGTYTDLDTSEYKIDFVTTPMRVHMKTGAGYQADLNLYRLKWNTTTVEMPLYVRQAQLMIIGHYYENRQDVGKERIFEVPMNSRYLLDRYRKETFT